MKKEELIVLAKTTERKAILEIIEKRMPSAIVTNRQRADLMNDVAEFVRTQCIFVGKAESDGSKSYKVALTASHFENEKVAELLSQCQIIYTSQANNYEQIKERFKFTSEVRVIPNITESILRLIRSWHSYAEFITFKDIMDLKDK